MTEPNTKTGGQELLALDLLRGGAAVLVMLAHLRAMTWVEYGALPAGQQGPLTAGFFLATRLGMEAVAVFFVLSGLFVGGRVAERAAKGRFDLKAYSIDRISRILLPLIPACIFTEIVAQLVSGLPFRPLTFFGGLVGLNGVVTPNADNPVLWSLAYEIWFYVLAGALGALASLGRGRLIAFGVVGLCLLVFVRLEAAYLLFWLLGAAAAGLANLRRPLLAFLIGLVVAALGTALSQAASGSDSVQLGFAIPREAGLGVLCIGLCLCLPWLSGGGVTRRLQALRGPITLLSGMSYTLYLTHYPLNTILNLYLPPAARIDMPSIGVFVFRIAVSLVFAWLMYLAFERHTATVRRWMRRRLDRAYGEV